jgi:hypothetical protein
MSRRHFSLPSSVYAYITCTARFELLLGKALQLCGRARRELLQRATSPHHQRDFGCFSVQQPPSGGCETKRWEVRDAALFWRCNWFQLLFACSQSGISLLEMTLSRPLFQAENELPDCNSKMLSIAWCIFDISCFKTWKM